MPTTIAGKTTYTLKEVAEGLGVYYQTVKGWVTASPPKINVRKVGQSYRVTATELRRLIREQNSTANA